LSALPRARRPAPPTIKGNIVVTQKEPLPPLTPEQTDLVEQRLAAARDSMALLVNDATLAHHYCNTNNRGAAWRSFRSLACNQIMPEASLSVRVNLTSMTMRQAVELVCPTRQQGLRLPPEIVRDNNNREFKKAQAVNRICMAAHDLLLDYPQRHKGLEDRLQFFQDHVASSSRWLQAASAAVHGLAHPRPVRKPEVSPGQQNLFS